MLSKPLSLFPMKKMRIIFIQLPLLNHANDYSMGNVELASATITGYIYTYSDYPVEIETLPNVLTQFASDRIIGKYIISSRPDIVAFTCYLWNIERNLLIADMIKQIYPDIEIIFGGPEINFGSCSFQYHRPQVDYFVIGEGEWFIQELLSKGDLQRCQMHEKGNRIIIQPPGELIPAEKIYEPVSGKRLNPMPDGSIYFELLRGCPYRCSYCLYSKNYCTLRELPFSLLKKTMTDKYITRHVSEIYILSPALNITRDAQLKLKILADLKHGFALHSEMRVEGITDNFAALLYKAGFRSMEVGLQTMNVETLQLVGRDSKPDRVIEGIKILKNKGIKVNIGIIPGLPGDTRETFLSMIEQLVSHGLHDDIELYPLMILPGTAIRDSAIKEHVNFNHKPPYYYNYGWGCSFDDISFITRHIESETGFTHITDSLPEFTTSADGLYIKGIAFNGDDRSNWDSQHYINIIDTNVFSFHITITNEQNFYTGLSRLVNNLPKSELFNVIVYGDFILDEKIIMSKESLLNEDHLLRRLNIFHEWKHGMRFKFYQVFEKIKRYKQAKKRYSIIKSIFAISAENHKDLSVVDDQDYILILKNSFKYIAPLISKFEKNPDSLAFVDESEQEEYYTMIGLEFVKLPFRFRIERIQ